MPRRFARGGIRVLVEPWMAVCLGAAAHRMTDGKIPIRCLIRLYGLDHSGRITVSIRLLGSRNAKHCSLAATRARAVSSDLSGNRCQPPHLPRHPRPLLRLAKLSEADHPTMDR